MTNKNEMTEQEIINDLKRQIYKCLEYKQQGADICESPFGIDDTVDIDKKALDLFNSLDNFYHNNYRRKIKVLRRYLKNLEYEIEEGHYEGYDTDEIEEGVETLKELSRSIQQ